MKMIIEIDPIEEMDYAQIVSNMPKISYGIFEIRHNMRKTFEWEIDANKYKDQYELLEGIMEHLSELFPNVDTE